MLYSITLTIKDGAHRIAPMEQMSIGTPLLKKSRFPRFALSAVVSATLIFAGCGLAYQAGTRIKATRMSDTLQVGQTSPADTPFVGRARYSDVFTGRNRGLELSL